MYKIALQHLQAEATLQGRKYKLDTGYNPAQIRNRNV